MGSGCRAPPVRSCPTCRGAIDEGAAKCPHCSAVLGAHKFRLHPSTPEDVVAAHRSKLPAPKGYPEPEAPVDEFAALADAQSSMTPSASTPPPSAPAYGRAPTAPTSPARAPGTPPAPPRTAAARPSVARAGTGAPAVLLGDKIRRHKTRIAIIGVVALLALIAGGAIYYNTAPTAQYPERYLLTEREAPSGLLLGPLPAEARNQLGSEANPGPLNEGALDQFGQFTGARPKVGWVQVFSDNERNDVLVNFALRFEDAESAEKWTNTAQVQCRDGKTNLYRAGSVVVFLFAEDELGVPKLKEAAETLESKAPKLERIC